MQIKAKFRSACATCHYTVWAGEVVNFFPGSTPKTGYVTHLDCVNSIKDKSPRFQKSVVTPEDNKVLSKMILSKNLLRNP